MHRIAVGLLLSLPLVRWAGDARGAGEIDDATLARLERSVSRFEPVTDRTGVRELFEFALEATARGWRPDLVERALDVAERMQDRNPSSPTHGNFRWYWFNERPVDLNAVEFSMERAALLWIAFRDRLTAGIRERLERLSTFAVEGIRRHRVREGYTNIFLMKTWNCIALGEATGRDDLAAEGYRMLERWVLHVWGSGIREYLSPTYYAVDLRSLGLLARFARRAEGRALAEIGLELFWTDIAANWFEPAQRLGGAHSRDYDYLTGRGALDGILRRHGWMTDDQRDAPDVFDDLSAREPPAGARALAARLPRFVRQRWGERPWENAAQHVGRRFGIGSAGSTYATMDKPFVVNLSGDRTTPVVCFFMDGRGDPYGRRRIPEGASGHNKALHLQPFLASVQRGPEVLMAAAVDPAAPAHFRHQTDAACVLSQIFFPMRAEVYEGEEGVAIVPGERRVLAGDRAVFLRLGDVALGIRFLVRDACGGGVAPLVIAGDGAAHGAARLTVEHATSKPSGRVAVAFWARCEEGMDDAGFDAFRRRFCGAPARVTREGDRLGANVAGASGAMRLEVDLAREERLVLEGAEPGWDAALLAVDGRDLGREILGRAAPVARYAALLEAAAAGGGKDASACEEVIEAESARFLSGEMERGRDDGASGDGFLWMPEPEGVEEGGEGRAVWLVRVPRAGAYHLWGRVRSPGASDDSFFVRLDQGRAGGAVREIEWHTGIHRGWEWARVTSHRAGRVRAEPVDLVPGTLWLEVRGREKGTALDAFFLTRDPRAEPGRGPGGAMGGGSAREGGRPRWGVPSRGLTRGRSA